jgi:hypothetical protein
VKVGARLAQILDRETSGRLSVATFVDHYMRLLDFPADVMAALSKGEVNLFEAEQLARVTAARLGGRQRRPSGSVPRCFRRTSGAGHRANGCAAG